QTLQTVFKHDNFRDIQEQVLHTVRNNQDVIAIMRTSEGKTLVHALPAALSFPTGVYVFTVVVYPLLSLIDNQMRELSKAHIPCAVLNGNTTFDQKASIHADIGNRILRCILTTPEQLARPSFSKMMQHVLRSNYKQIRLVEAHVALEWKSFRNFPGVYEIKKEFMIPTLFLSATLTQRNALELSQLFGLKDTVTLMSQNLERPNIEYKMTSKGKSSYPQAIDTHISLWNWTDQLGIVYCSTRSETDAIAEILGKMQVEVEAGSKKYKYKVTKYHADMPLADRDANQLAWETGEALIMVATSAFALGINCSNVRFVIHTKMPTSMGTFLQESGRAGLEPAEMGSFAEAW
ncbi:P-loop containing nucleoside triphosphate hydrolase protein, partial [Phlyctochytrium arcticum]